MSPFYGMDSLYGQAIGLFSMANVISLLTLILSHVVYGLVSRKLAGKKGYEGYFWTGFLLGIIGLIYVAGLPVNRRRSRRRYADAQAMAEELGELLARLDGFGVSPSALWEAGAARLRRERAPQGE